MNDRIISMDIGRDTDYTSFNLIMKNDYNDIMVVLVADGLKIELRKEALDKLSAEQYIIDNFNLNIMRINRWWYSVYFEKINK